MDTRLLANMKTNIQCLQRRHIFISTPYKTCRRSVLIARAKKQNDASNEAQIQQQSWQALSPEEQEASPYGNPYGGNQQYYHQYQPYPPPQPASSGPPYGWIAFGAVFAIVASKLWSFFSPANGGPQAKMMNFMMQQAMKGAAGAGGAGGANPMGGFPDLSKAGGFPQSGSPGSGFPPGFPSAGFPSSTASKPQSPVFDTQAKDVSPPSGGSTTATTSSTTSTSGSSVPGAKFQERKAAEAKDGSRRRRRSGSQSGFTDVDQEDKASTSVPKAAVNPAVSADEIRPPTGDFASGQASTTGDSNGASVDMLETFLKDPQMQELLYQYLPENMRNKETFEWMLKNPEYRAQLETMLQQQGANLNPDVYKQMQGINSQEVTDQLAQFGMTPADVVQRIMGDPELAQAFSKPKVQQAVMELQNDSMAILKYQNDPDVMMVFEKMSQLFPDIKP